MSTEGSTVALAALLDGISLLQGQVAALTQSNSRIEDSHDGQPATSILKTMLDRSIKG